MNFWRKTGQKGKQGKNNIIVNTCNESSEKIQVINNVNNEKNLSCLQTLFASEIGKIDDFTTFNSENSRLSKTLLEVLNDKGALSYFIQYLDTRGALNYVKFWLDVESFRSSLQNSDISFKICLTRDELETPRPIPSVSHDSLSVSTDCDSFTADSGSLFEYSYNINNVSSIESPNEPNNFNVTPSQCDNLDFKLSTNKMKLHQDIIADATRIYKKYIATDASHSIRCPEDMRQRIVENLCVCLTCDCFDKAQQFVFHIMENDFYNDFLRSNFHCKHQVDLLTSGNITLSDILYNETALFYFMEFLEQEQCRNLLEFWIAITNFRHNLKTNQNLNNQQIQEDAIILYDKYFSLQATNPLGFPDVIRFDIEQNICDENGLQVTCFDKPLKLVEIVLEQNFLKSFLSSQLFFKYLSDLISTIQMTNLPGRHRRIGSDSSSEISSISAHNTLLAMEDLSSTKSKKRRNGETDMSIDTKYLYDPDSLWRRKQTGLQLGRVTELGRFETDIEPEPDKRSESKFGNVIKRLVNLQEDKEKEEMAWQIAEMIVKDITRLTLNESPF
ncbi:A-kinase anchor protein 10, mitochondrial [Chrysoperla carnea]|uniref:A-kinase anchor protein 10, mitochondrial n=1 Tax=Chrysoperla carnea TaxID=189513 RepID=UPI001D0799C9|nr:A-kinase anchor protein 10, mitochondrial [Chrysoperla carnea]